MILRVDPTPLGECFFIHRFLDPFRSVPVRSVNNDQHNSLVPIPRPIFLIIITAGEKYAVIIISEKSAWGRGYCCGFPIMADVGLPVPAHS